MAHAITQSVVARLSVEASPQVQLALDLARLDAATLRRRLACESKRNPYVAVSWQPNDAATDHVPSGPDGLYPHALKQARLCTQPANWPIALHFVEALGPAGWLERSVADIAEDASVGRDRAEAVLQDLQSAEPTGLFARSLSDCLSLQTREQGFLDPDCARMLDDLAGFQRLGLEAWAAGLGLPKTRVEAIMVRISALDPKPGARFQSSAQDTRIPDVLVRRNGTGWTVSLNRSALPDVTVCDGEQIPDADATARQSARRLEQAVRLRNIAVLTVAKTMVRCQSDFLLNGPASCRPLTRRSVARDAGFHASTVGRICAGLLLDTPQGVLGAETFFGPGLAHADSQTETSAAAIRARISDLIAGEDADHPLSDHAISRQLRIEGPAVARRTVQKYRSMLGIPGAWERRRENTGRDERRA